MQLTAYLGSSHELIWTVRMWKARNTQPRLALPTAVYAMLTVPLPKGCQLTSMHS